MRKVPFREIPELFDQKIHPQLSPWRMRKPGAGPRPVAGIDHPEDSNQPMTRILGVTGLSFSKSNESIGLPVATGRSTGYSLMSSSPPIAWGAVARPNPLKGKMI